MSAHRQGGRHADGAGKTHVDHTTERVESNRTLYENAYRLIPSNSATMGADVGSGWEGADTLVEPARGTMPLRARVEQTLAAVGLDPGACATMTLGVATLPSVPTEGDAEAGLATVRVDVDGSLRDADYRVTKVLGEGGMGRVYAATSRALEREVALKCLLPHAGARHAASLLHEARVNGRLEHPHVVPVHAVASDDVLGPIVVMKRVHGEDWRARLQTRDRREPETLSEPLRVLIEIANAVAFAHEQGIAHCDIKPRNVMLDAYGEAYLVDWGLAIELANLPSSDTPLGTPAYMAPEMTRGQASVASDIYLLGATLFHVLYGHPPHRASGAVDAMLLSLAGVVVPADPLVPEELRTLCVRAMARDPDERFDTALCFRDALLGFLEHRGAQRIAHAAIAQLDAIAADASGVGVDTTDDEVVRILTALDACAARLAQSLELWPDNPRARTAQRGVDETKLGIYLARQNLVSAREIMTRIPALPAPLSEAFRGLEREQALAQRARRELSHLAYERSLSVGSRPRVHLSLALVAGLAALAIWAWTMRRRAELGSTELLLWLSALVCGSVFIGCALSWKRLAGNFMSRLATLGLVAAPVAVLLHRLVAWLVGDLSRSVVQLDLMLLTAVALTLGGVHRGFFLVAGGCYASYVIASLVPETTRPLINLIPIVAAICVVELWRRLVLSDQALVDRVQPFSRGDAAQ